MLILAILWTLNTASATKVDTCVAGLSLTEDRGAEFRKIVGAAAAEWFGDRADPRRPRVLKQSVVEVAHGTHGGGSAIVQLHVALGAHRIPVLVRVEHENNRITNLSLVEKGYPELDGSCARGPGFAACNTAMAKLLQSTTSTVTDLTALVLSSGRSPEPFFEILVSGSVEGRAFEKIYFLFTDREGPAQFDESAIHRYNPIQLREIFAQLLLEGRKDPTLRISSLDRLSLDTWRVVYSLGKIERVPAKRSRDPKRSPRSRSKTQIFSSSDSGGVHLTGEGLRTQSSLLKVNPDFKFRLERDLMR